MFTFHEFFWFSILQLMYLLAPWCLDIISASAIKTHISSWLVKFDSVVECWLSLTAGVTSEVGVWSEKHSSGSPSQPGCLLEMGYSSNLGQNGCQAGPEHSTNTRLSRLELFHTSSWHTAPLKACWCVFLHFQKC